MKIFSRPVEMTAWAEQHRVAGRSVGLVPTMGYFHEGHLSLMRAARRRGDLVVVSLFVNPMQFGPSEDLSRYPRDLQRDLSLAEGEGVHAVFAPEALDMYPEGFASRIHISGITEGLCGASRPGHFDGVATVVAKLFNIVKPHFAVFGQKDFQQLAVIERMVSDLNLDVEIIGHPVVREADGLAMSSRNVYLGAGEREVARCLPQALDRARDLVEGGERRADRVLAEIAAGINKQPGVRIDYCKLVDRLSLHEKQQIDRDTILVMAVFVGRTRLIDNGAVWPDGTGNEVQE